MESKTEVKTFRIDYWCPKCQDAQLVSTSRNKKGKYKHECNGNDCKHSELLDKQYPFLTFKDVETL